MRQSVQASGFRSHSGPIDDAGIEASLTHTGAVLIRREYSKPRQIGVATHVPDAEVSTMRYLQERCQSLSRGAEESAALKHHTHGLAVAHR